MVWSSVVFLLKHDCCISFSAEHEHKHEHEHIGVVPLAREIPYQKKVSDMSGSLSGPRIKVVKTVDALALNQSLAISDHQSSAISKYEIFRDQIAILLSSVCRKCGRTPF